MNERGTTSSPAKANRRTAFRRFACADHPIVPQKAAHVEALRSELADAVAYGLLANR